MPLSRMRHMFQCLNQPYLCKCSVAQLKKVCCWWAQTICRLGVRFVLLLGGIFKVMSVLMLEQE